MNTMRDVKILLSMSIAADISDLSEQQFKIVRGILDDGRKCYAILVDDRYLECIHSYSDVQAVFDGIEKLEAYLKNTSKLLGDVSSMVERNFNWLAVLDMDFAENEDARYTGGA